MKALKDYSPAEQLALKTQICPECNEDEINYFLRVCAAKDVDPFAGLMYVQKRKNNKTGKDKVTVNPTVDGSRASAARSEAYAGSDEPEFDSETNDVPVWCKVTVYRMVNNVRCAFTAKCRWKEFVPQAPNDFQWRAKPYHMLAKCTEVQALRKAFPELVSAAGEDEYEPETEGETPEQTAEREAQERARVEKSRLKLEWANAVKAFVPHGKSENDLLVHLSLSSVDQVTRDHMTTLRSWYEELQKGEVPA